MNMRKILSVFFAVWIIAAPLLPQSANKLRVIAAPGITTSDAKDWKNTLTVSGQNLVLNCPKCTPIQSITVAEADVGALRYGQNAYHHWVSGVVTGVFSLGIGLIVGLMPHHQHYFSIDLKSGKVVGIQADKSDYKEIAGMLHNSSGQPIQVTQKDAHYLNGFNIKIVAAESK
jgi:hypothetical protein